MPTLHTSDLPTAESETVGFLVSLKYNVATVSTHSTVQPSQQAPCYSSTNVLLLPWDLMHLLLTKIHQH